MKKMICPNWFLCRVKNDVWPELNSQWERHSWWCRHAGLHDVFTRRVEKDGSSVQKFVQCSDDMGADKCMFHGPPCACVEVKDE